VIVPSVTVNVVELRSPHSAPLVPFPAVIVHVSPAEVHEGACTLVTYIWQVVVEQSAVPMTVGKAYNKLLLERFIILVAVSLPPASTIAN